MNQENKNKGTSLIPIVIAAVAGALGAFLYQEENRTKVKNKWEKVKDKGAEKLATKMEEVKKKGSEQLGVLQEKLEEGQIAANKEIDKAKSKLEESNKDSQNT